MKYRMINIEDYDGKEPVQYVGYYVLNKTSDMPKPDVLFVEDFTDLPNTREVKHEQ